MKSCPSCGSDNRRPYIHRAPGSKYADASLCFNGRPKAAHICVAECAKTGMFCRNCRRLCDTGRTVSLATYST
ncbi:hypothetical protein OG800_49620 (plasmid) [Streptomyces sp. NBC_00445]|uniref:hypothetical protein n=1 Tax=Streptomyces sp. NBC_00445 TaxID=2975745 RepID=UPI002E1AB0AC